MQKRVRAIIINEGLVVLIKRIKSDKTYYVFPGGGVEENEGIEQALKREVKEEINVEVDIDNLLVELPFNKPGIDQVEYFYICKITSGIISQGDGLEYKPDNGYEGVHEIVQIPINDIKNIDLLPSEVKSLVLQLYA